MHVADISYLFRRLLCLSFTYFLVQLSRFIYDLIADEGLRVEKIGGLKKGAASLDCAFVFVIESETVKSYSIKTSSIQPSRSKVLSLHAIFVDCCFFIQFLNLKLFRAVEGGQLGAVQTLIHDKADVNARDSAPPNPVGSSGVEVGSNLTGS